MRLRTPVACLGPFGRPTARPVNARYRPVNAPCVDAFIAVQILNARNVLERRLIQGEIDELKRYENFIEGRVFVPVSFDQLPVPIFYKKVEIGSVSGDT